MIRYTLQKARISFGESENSLFGFTKFTGYIELDGNFFSLSDAKIISEEFCEESCETHAEYLFSNGILWCWEVRTENNSLVLETSIRNVSLNDIRIGKWSVLQGKSSDSTDFSLCNPEACRIFNWNPWYNDVLDLSGQGEISTNSIVMFHISEMPSAYTFCGAFVTVDRMSCQTYFVYNKSNGGFQRLDFCCDGSQYRLRPNQLLRAETLRLAYYKNQYEALDGWANELYQKYQPSFEGTCGVQLGSGVWNHTTEYDVQDLRDEICDFCDNQLSQFNMKLISGGTHSIMKWSIPGHWMLFDTRNDGSSYEEDLIHYHHKGWNFKFWFSPFWFFGEADETLKENWDNLLRDEKNEIICQDFHGFWEFARGPYAKKYLHQYFLDGSHPKTKAYLRKVFTFYRNLGCRAYMMDFLQIIPGSKYYDDSKLPIEVSRDIFQVIRETAGKDTHIQTAVSSSPGFIGCINSARVTRDFGEGRPQAPYPNWRNASYCMHDNHFSNIHSFMQNAASSYFTNKKIYVNDLNELTIDKPVPENFAQMAVTMFGLNGDSPVAIGDNIKYMSPDRLRMLKMILPRTEGNTIPVDLFERTLLAGGCRILKKQIHTSWDDWMLVTVFNSDPNGQDFTQKICFADLGFDENEQYVVYEFWNCEYIGIYKGYFNTFVPKGNCKLFRISKRRPYPWILSTDMHIEQGKVELEDVKWDNENLTLSGFIKRPAGEFGRLFFLLPLLIKVKDCYRINTMKEVIDMQTVCTYPVQSSQDREKFCIEFERLDDDGICHTWWLPFHTIEQRHEWLKKNRTVPANRIIE